jgi:hypothetical protein
MDHKVKALIEGFASLVLYADHLGHCLQCLNDRSGQCEKRLTLLLRCAENLKPLRQGLAVEYHQIIETISGLKFSKEVQRDLLEKYDVATYNPTEPEPSGPHPA